MKYTFLVNRCAINSKLYQTIVHNRNKKHVHMLCLLPSILQARPWCPVILQNHNLSTNISKSKVMHVYMYMYIYINNK